MGFLELQQEPGVYSRVNSGDGHSKLEFVQRRQDSCLVMMDTSGI